MMNNCTNNFIKRVIGVTRTFKWTVTTNGAAVPLVAEDLTLQLVPPRGEAVSLPFDVDDNIVSFTWQGEDQHIIGCYSLILWANYGEDNQRRVDIHNFVELIPWSDRQSGEYSDLVEETIELETADFGENIMVVDNLNSTSATDALSANMGRQLNVTKQDVIQDLAAIRSGAAAGAAVKEWAKNDPLITDDGTQVSASKLAFNGNLFEQWVPGIASSIGLKGIAGFLKLADISQWDSAYNDRMLPTVAAVKAKLQAVLTALATIEAVIPSQASSTNKLTDKDYVDGAIATNTANFVGTFDTLAELQAVQNPTKNDYGFVIESDAQGNEYYDRYKYTGTQWLYEYKVESTPFTTEQWAAIQSGITAALVTKLSALPTNAELNTALAGKQPVIDDLTTIRSGAAAGATAYQKPSGGIPKTDLASAVQTSLGKADAAAPQATTYTKAEVDAALALKQTSSQLATINGSRIDQGGNVTIVAAEGQTITIDAAPTKDSNNAVSSGGVYPLTFKGYIGKSATFTGLNGINTRTPTGISGRAGYKYKIIVDNTNGTADAYFRTYTNLTDTYVISSAIGKGKTFSRLMELAQDCEQLYVSCAMASAIVTLEVVGTNEDMLPLDLSNILEQGNYDVTVGTKPAKLNSSTIVRLTAPIPSIKRGMTDMVVWFATTPPAIVRDDGVDYSQYRWRYRAYFLDGDGKLITAPGNFRDTATSFDGSKNTNPSGNYDGNALVRTAKKMLLVFAYSNGTSSASITPDDIPCGSLRLVIGEDYTAAIDGFYAKGVTVSEITGTSTDSQVPTAKAVYDFASAAEGTVRYDSEQSLTSPQRYMATNNIGLGGKNSVTFAKGSSEHSSAIDKVKVFATKNHVIKIGLFTSVSGANVSGMELRAVDAEGVGHSLGNPIINGYVYTYCDADIVAVGVYMNPSVPAGDYTLEVSGGVAGDDVLNGADILSKNKGAMDYITTARQQLSTNYGAGYNKYLAFLQLTDTHADFKCMESALDFAQGCGIISSVFHTGDIIETASTAGRRETEWNDLMSRYSIPVLSIPGNHEFSSNPYTDSGIHNWLYSSTLKTRNGEIHPIINGEEKNYFYRDFTMPALNDGTLKYIRVIGLYCYDMPVSTFHKAYQWFSQEQVDWLVDTLEDTLEPQIIDNQSYACGGVIVLSHYIISASHFLDTKFNLPDQRDVDVPIGVNSPVGNPVSGVAENRYFFAKIFKAFIEGGTVNDVMGERMPATGEAVAEATISVNHTFTAAGKFAGLLCGHAHSGGMALMKTDTNTVDSRLPVVISPCSTYAETQNRKWWGRTNDYHISDIYSNLRDCLNVVVYDTEREKLKIVRVGSTITNDLDECKSFMF